MARRRARGGGRKGWRDAAWGGGAALVLLLAVVALAHRPPPRVPMAAAPVQRPAAPASVGEKPVPAPPPATEAAPPWLRFAVAAPDAAGRSRVAIVIDDLGIDRVRTAEAIALAPALTLSFMAYAGDVRTAAESARRAGHELLVHVPMEPMDRAIDMGPEGLATDLPRAELLRRLRWDLDRLDGYVGINNHMGSRFTADSAGMAVVIDEVKARGLLFLDSRTTAATVGARIAERDGVPFAERDVFLDDDMSRAAIERRLAELEAVARRQGTAIAIGHPHDATLAALAEWIAALPGKGLVLVPLTDIVKARAGALTHEDKRAGAGR